MRLAPPVRVFSRPIQSCRTCPVGSPCRDRCPLTPRFVHAGAVIATAGEHHPCVYLIREGLLAWQVCHDGKEARIAGIRGPRALVGMEAMRDRPLSLRLVAFSDAWICGASASDLKERCRAEPELAAAMSELFVEATLEAQRDLANAVDRAVVRVARLLLQLSATGPRTETFEKKAMARMLDLRPETFSRCLRALSRRGLVCARGPLKVVDARGLERIASGEDVPEVS